MDVFSLSLVIFVIVYSLLAALIISILLIRGVL